MRELVPNRMEKLTGIIYCMKKIIGGLDFSYVKIDACLNDCILY